jgi:hypothetical protein
MDVRSEVVCLTAYLTPTLRNLFKLIASLTNTSSKAASCLVPCFQYLCVVIRSSVGYCCAVLH